MFFKYPGVKVGRVCRGDQSAEICHEIVDLPEDMGREMSLQPASDAEIKAAMASAENERKMADAFEKAMEAQADRDRKAAEAEAEAARQRAAAESAGDAKTGDPAAAAQNEGGASPTTTSEPSQTGPDGASDQGKAGKKANAK